MVVSWQHEPELILMSPNEEIGQKKIYNNDSIRKSVATKTLPHWPKGLHIIKQGSVAKFGSIFLSLTQGQLRTSEGVNGLEVD